MLNGKRILAVVPARGGSKGIKLKNLRPVAGVPLVAHAGNVIAQLDFIDCAIVSTDHDEIAAAAEAAGLKAPFRRPDDLSGDRIGDWDVLIHALKFMEQDIGEQFDIVVMLQPTSPSRTPDHVRQTVQHLIRGSFDAVWTLSETDSKQHPLKQLVLGETGEFGYYDPAGASIIARQQLKPVYHRNGIAYAITRNCLTTQRTIMGKRTGYIIIDDPVINIDTEEDLAWAEFVLGGQGGPAS